MLQTSDRKTPLDDLANLCKKDMEKVNQEIRNCLQSSVQLIPTLADHLINAGGKRLRPMLTMAVRTLLSIKSEAPIKYATAIELIHSATLLHDDIVDESALRRGRKTANLIWGNSASVLVGDYLFSQAFTLMVAGRNLNALDLLSTTATLITEGEVNQLVSLNNLTLDISDYYKIIRAKTAALFSAACEVNAHLTPLPPEQKTALKTYGLEVGLAFQLSDDVLDYGGLTQNMGKTVGDDFHEKKVTLPVLLAYQKSSDKAKVFWERTIVKGQQNKTDLALAQAYLTETHALKETLDIACRHAEKARQSLSVFPDHPIKSVLQSLPSYIVERVH